MNTSRLHPSHLSQRIAAECGQTTAEYALVLVAAATIALLVVTWAGDTGAIGDFFDTIIERITSMVP